MEKLYAVGERVEKHCSVCNEQLGHIVKSVTKQGKVSRVNCSRCGQLGTFKAATILTKSDSSAAKPGMPYEPSKTYRTGQFMLHPSFGNGEVMTVLTAKKIDVLFEDKVRRLIHSRL